MLSGEEYEDYCTKMGNSPVWGGQVEIRALATCIKKPIQVEKSSTCMHVFCKDYTPVNNSLIHFSIRSYF